MAKHRLTKHKVRSPISPRFVHFGSSLYTGGTTYCAIASLYLVPAPLLPWSLGPPLSQRQQEQTIRWLISNQGGGFRGRTEKDPDTCYCWWCGAALQVRPLALPFPV